LSTPSCFLCDSSFCHSVFIDCSSPPSLHLLPACRDPVLYFRHHFLRRFLENSTSLPVLISLVLRDLHRLAMRTRRFSSFLSVGGRRVPLVESFRLGTEFPSLRGCPCFTLDTLSLPPCPSLGLVLLVLPFSFSLGGKELPTLPVQIRNPVSSILCLNFVRIPPDNLTLYRHPEWVGGRRSLLSARFVSPLTPMPHGCWWKARRRDLLSCTLRAALSEPVLDRRLGSALPSGGPFFCVFPHPRSLSCPARCLVSSAGPP